MKKPIIIKGNFFSDQRGILRYNNDFDASQIKRIYNIQNSDTQFVRGWQGHKIEQRWFSAICGKFKIIIKPIKDLETQTNTEIFEFILEENAQDILHIPQGYATAIQSLQKNAILLVMSDYKINEIIDEYKFPYTL